jgi:MoaA/NifB/PqqE/SkfB family radical SAM enzyme
MENNLPKYFCEHIWTHLYKDTDDSVKLCCIDRGESLGNLKESTVEEIRNGEEFKKIRRDVLDGKKLERCIRCWENEDKGLSSYRLSESQYDVSKFTEKSNPINFLDYRVDNVCNLGCKSCGAAFSTKLIDVDLKLGNITEEQAKSWRYVNKKNTNISEITNHISELNDIYFAGGEPILNQQHWDTLNYLKENNKLGNTVISYSTNLTKLDFKKYKVEDYWPYISELNVMASIDGMGNNFEYFRTGANWNQILKNIKRVNDIDDSILSISSTVNWMNIKSILSLFTYLLDNNLVSSFDKLDLNSIINHIGASVSATPKIARDEILYEIDIFLKYVKDNYNDFIESELVKTLYSYKKDISNSEENPYELYRWLVRLKAIDNQYGTNIENILDFKSNDVNEYIRRIYSKIKIS